MYMWYKLGWMTKLGISNLGQGFVLTCMSQVIDINLMQSLWNLVYLQQLLQQLLHQMLQQLLQTSGAPISVWHLLEKSCLIGDHLAF